MHSSWPGSLRIVLYHADALVLPGRMDHVDADSGIFVLRVKTDLQRCPIWQSKFVIRFRRPFRRRKTDRRKTSDRAEIVLALQQDDVAHGHAAARHRIRAVIPVIKSKERLQDI